MIFWAVGGGLLVLGGIIHLLNSSPRPAGRHRTDGDGHHGAWWGDSSGDDASTGEGDAPGGDEGAD
jgi:hypothetical protein